MTEFKSINVNFNQGFLDRLENLVDSPELNSMDLRADILTSYRELLAYLQAYTTLSIDNTYTETVKQINLLIEQFNKLVAGRSSTKEEEEEEVLTQE